MSSRAGSTTEPPAGIKIDETQAARKNAGTALDGFNSSLDTLPDRTHERTKLAPIESVASSTPENPHQEAHFTQDELAQALSRSRLAKS